jgi:hypothetical protein
VHSRHRIGWLLVICVLLLLVPQDAHRPAPDSMAASQLVWAGVQAHLSLDSGHRDIAPAPAHTASLRQYWQVGLVAGPEASEAVAMRTSIVTRLPQAVASRTTNYFWIGSYLADGSFIQIGYYVASSDSRHAGWFYCAYTAQGDQGPCVYGPAGSAGGNGETHTYSLEVVQSTDRAAPAQPRGPATWIARLDGAALGQFSWPSGTTGPNSPSIYAESSGFAPHLPIGQLGPVDFIVAVQTRTAGQASYIMATHLQPVYAAPDVCPPYGVAADGRGGALLGSDLLCPSGDGWLR